MKPRLTQQIAGAAIAYVAIAVGHCVFRHTWITLAVYYGGIAAYVGFVHNAAVIRDLLRGWRIRLGLATMAVFTLAGPAMWVLWPLAARPGVDFAAWLAERGIAGGGFWWFAAAAVFVNPALEEILWRGCLMDDARRPSWIDAAFAGYHVMAMAPVVNIPFCGVAFVMLAAVSWCLRYVRAATGGLATCWAAHTGADISIMAFLYLLLRR